MSPLIVWSTVPGLEVADQLATALVTEGLAACVHRFAAGDSVYRWEGRVTRESELLLMIKTTAAAYPRLQERLRALHPYQTPEILATPVSAGLPDYLTWLADNVPPGA